jgi:ribonuclease HII
LPAGARRIERVVQQALFQQQQGLTAGVDEVGRGPLAGPVVAAAVVLCPNDGIEGLADSKALKPARREQLARDIQARALAWSIGWSDAAEIDAINILQATHLAMRRAIIGLRIRPVFVQVDGNRLPNLVFDGQQIDGDAIVGGDASVPAISAASIIAKVWRDGQMTQLDRLYPDYGFARHKGYGTAEHMEILARIGPCQAHRRSFRPLSGV